MFKKAILFNILLLSISLTSSQATNDRYGLIFSVEVPSTVKQGILRDLNRLKNIRGKVALPIHDRIFGKLEGRDLGEVYFRYFSERVQRVEWIPRGDTFVIGAGNPDFPFSIFTTLKYETGLDVDSKEWINHIERLSILIHEARHNELFLNGNNWPHTSCPKKLVTLKDVRGSPGCDSDPEGAYATGVVFLRNLELYCTNCRPIEKKAAGTLARAILPRILSRKNLINELWPEGIK